MRYAKITIKTFIEKNDCVDFLVYIDTDNTIDHYKFFWNLAISSVVCLPHVQCCKIRGTNSCM